MILAGADELSLLVAPGRRPRLRRDLLEKHVDPGKLVVRCDERGYCIYNYSKRAVGRDFIRYPGLSLTRGLVARGDGEEAVVYALPFAKFFNVDEVPAARPLRDADYIVTEKLDGTLIIVWVDEEGSVRAATRGMLDAHGQEYVRIFWNAVRRRGYTHEVESLAREDRTLMFELVNERVPASKVAGRTIEYSAGAGEWTPYLIAYRDHYTLEIVYDVSTPLPRPRVLDAVEVEEIIARARFSREWSDREGIVVYYPRRHYYGARWWNFMLKSKNIYYLAASTINARLLIRLAVDGRADDIIPLIEDPRRRALAEQVVSAVNRILEKIEILDATASANPGAVERISSRRLKAYLRRETTLEALLTEQAPRSVKRAVNYLASLERAVDRALRTLAE